MKLALIPPISWISTTSCTDYQLLLPQLLMYPKYVEHYTRLAKSEDQHLILDNGANEGAQVNSTSLVRMADEVGVDEVVVPDVLLDDVATLSRMATFFDRVKDKDVGNLKYMGVAQGSTEEAVHSCISTMMSEFGSKLHSIALPRHLLETLETVMARLTLAEYIRDHAREGIAIHCLGASPLWPKELLALAKQGIVRGMDTSMPYNFAYYGWHVEDSIHLGHVTRPARYFNHRSIMFKNDCLHSNIGTMKRWANGTE